MFTPLPDPRNDIGVVSFDVLQEADARQAVGVALRRHKEAENQYQEAYDEEVDPVDADGIAAHVSSCARQAAMVANIQALLLTASYIEGATNAWGTIIADEELFIKMHREITFRRKGSPHRSNRTPRTDLVRKSAG